MPAASQQQPDTRPRTYDMREAATLLNTGRTRLLRWLRNLNILNDENLPYRPYTARGYFVVDLQQVTLPTSGMTILRGTTRVTERGLLWLQKKIEQERSA